MLPGLRFAFLAKIESRFEQHEDQRYSDIGCPNCAAHNTEHHRDHIISHSVRSVGHLGGAQARNRSDAGPARAFGLTRYFGGTLAAPSDSESTRVKSTSCGLAYSSQLDIDKLILDTSSGRGGLLLNVSMRQFIRLSCHFLLHILTSSSLPSPSSSRIAMIIRWIHKRHTMVYHQILSR